MARGSFGLWACIVLILLLNVLDYGLTWHWLRIGVAEEGNLILRPFVGHPVSFALVKGGLIIGGCSVLWRYRDRALARMGAGLCAGFYCGVSVYHLIALYYLQ